MWYIFLAPVGRSKDLDEAIPPVSDCARKVRLTVKKVHLGIKKPQIFTQDIFKNFLKNTQSLEINLARGTQL
jgi:hypothetical protein